MVTLQQYLAQRDRLTQEHTRVSLVVQGGGMRGVYSMGALSALESAGLSSSFDVVIGSSAGAINGAYFLAGQARDAVDVYVKYLSNRKFIDFARVWKAVDIDYLVDVALRQKCPLNISKLRESPSLLKVILTDAETGHAAVVTNRDLVDFYEVIRATAAMPVLYNKRIKIGKSYFVDGGLVEDLPVARAVEEGATLVVAVLTRKREYNEGSKSPVFRLAVRLATRGQSDEIRALIGPDNEQYKRSIEMLVNPPDPERPMVSVIPQDEKLLVGRTTMDRRRLCECAHMGMRDMQDKLSEELSHPASNA